MASRSALAAAFLVGTCTTAAGVAGLLAYTGQLDPVMKQAQSLLGLAQTGAGVDGAGLLQPAEGP